MKGWNDIFVDLSEFREDNLNRRHVALCNHFSPSPFGLCYAFKVY